MDDPRTAWLMLRHFDLRLSLISPVGTSNRELCQVVDIVESVAAHSNGTSGIAIYNGVVRACVASGNTFAASRLRLGFTLIGQRRFREPSPASYALILAPSVSYRISEDWSAALGIEATQRWFERISNTAQENFTLEPVAALEYDIPESWLGGAEMARWFGRPAVDFFGAVERNWSNFSSARFTQVYAGFAFKAAWRF